MREGSGSSPPRRLYPECLFQRLFHFLPFSNTKDSDADIERGGGKGRRRLLFDDGLVFFLCFQMSSPVPSSNFLPLFPIVSRRLSSGLVSLFFFFHCFRFFHLFITTFLSGLTKRRRRLEVGWFAISNWLLSVDGTALAFGKWNELKSNGIEDDVATELSVSRVLLQSFLLDIAVASRTWQLFQIDRMFLSRVRLAAFLFARNRVWSTGSGFFFAF